MTKSSSIHTWGASLLIVAAGASACLEKRASSAAPSDAREVRDAADGTVAAETLDSSRDDALRDANAVDSDPVETQLDEVSCAPADLALRRTGTHLFSELDNASSAVVLDGVTLYGSQSRLANNGTRGPRNVVAIDLETGTELELRERDTDHTVLDARDGALVYLAAQRGRSANELRYRDMASGVEQVLFNGDASGSTHLVPGAHAWTRAPRVVEHDTAIWGEIGDGARSVARVRIMRAFDGAPSLTTLYEADGGIEAPELRRGHVAWTSYGAVRTLWLASPDDVVSKIAVGEIDGYALGDDALWWIEGGAVMRRSFGTAENVAVHAGPCALLDADAANAVAVCGPGASSGDGSGNSRGLPLFFDGLTAAATPLLGHGGAVIAGLRVHGARVAWVEYPEGVGCTGGPEQVGELLISAHASPRASAVVAEVLSGCWCCGAYWPPLRLALTDRALAWNYPGPIDPAEPFFSRADAVGWALFEAADCP